MKRLFTLSLMMLLVFTFSSNATEAHAFDIGNYPAGSITKTLTISDFEIGAVVKITYPSKVFSNQDLPIRIELDQTGSGVTNLDQFCAYWSTGGAPSTICYAIEDYNLGNKLVANGDTTQVDFTFNTSALTPGVHTNKAGIFGIDYDFQGSLDKETRFATEYLSFEVIDATDADPIIQGTAVYFADVDNPDTLADIQATLSASDDQDGDLTSSIINVVDNYTANSDVLGDYITTWSVTDNLGNTVTADVTVRVVDIVAPIITLNGDDPYYIEYGDLFNVPGITLTDNYDVYPTKDSINMYTIEPTEIIYEASHGATNSAGEWVDFSDIPIGTEVKMYIYFPHYDEYETATFMMKLEQNGVQFNITGFNPLNTIVTKYDENYIEYTFTTESELTRFEWTYSFGFGGVSTEDKDVIEAYFNEHGTTVYLYLGTDVPDLPLIDPYELNYDTDNTYQGIETLNDLANEVKHSTRIYTDLLPSTESKLFMYYPDFDNHSDDVVTLNIYEIIDTTRNYLFENQTVIIGDYFEKYDDNYITYTYTSSADKDYLGYQIIDINPTTYSVIQDYVTNYPDDNVVKLYRGTEIPDLPLVELPSLYEVTNDIDINTLGTYTVTYTSIDQSGNESISTRSVIVQDTTSPSLELLGNSDIYVNVGDSFTDPGVIKSDNHDIEGNLNPVITGSVDVNVLGDYVITYNLVDSSGNAAPQITRTVHIQDTTLPEITLNGDSTVYVEFGSSYTEQDATATDNYDPSVTVGIISSNLNISVLGSYQVEYQSCDSSGNCQLAYRTVIVQDTTAPIFNILSVNVFDTENKSLSEVLTEVSASDTYDGDITSNITTSNDTYSGNESTSGTYTIRLTVSDSSGNETILDLIIEVETDTPPVITGSSYLLTTEEADSMTQEEIRDWILNNRP